MTVKLILNPFANVGRAEKSVAQIEQAFAAHGLTLDLTVTDYPRHATELAREAQLSGRYSALVAAGGDGTLNEVVNGLVPASGDAPTMPLAILPLGTGNDFAEMQGLPKDFDVVAKLVAENRPKQVDLGAVTADGHTHYFDNVSAAAMEASVNNIALRYKRLSGRLRYVAAVIQALRNLQAWESHVRWDGGELSAELFLLSVCNSKRTGSTFLMAPDASVHDGLFDVVVVPRVGWGTVARVIPRLVNGTHISHPDVTYFQTSWLEVTSTPATPVHGDGELVADSAEKLRFEVLAGKLSLLMP